MHIRYKKTLWWPLLLICRLLLISILACQGSQNSLSLITFYHLNLFFTLIHIQEGKLLVQEDLKKKKLKWKKILQLLK